MFNQEIDYVDAPPLAFAFDIDGVLLRGPHVIPAARRALAILEGDNPMRKKIPYILLTNGGGSSEEARCQKLTAQLGFNIHPLQFIQSHTILKTVAQDYADRPVLVLGGRNGEVRKVAEEYGFKNAYTTLDVLAWNPAVWPFHTLTPSEQQSVKSADFSRTPIAAIFVFHDPRNWALDIQIICDAIQSGGIIGATPTVQHVRPSGPRRPELFFCNGDMLWKSDFQRPRFGQGAFRVAFQAVYESLTGSKYPCVQYGKPTEATYMFAKQVLRDRFRDLYGRVSVKEPHVYMVGDNPESDVIGANAAGWSSLLVRTGVYDPRQGPPAHVPTHEVEDVLEAVTWAIEREMQS
ncbi:uncharacterized protein FIBRA_07917 [Fibroporia radiculosa]|uniref:HAD-superfamily subfamily IIA hydrolase n=1 Tax=Fibroporia radiculosa TaxID=599839 RepID=J4IC28_9APHY|nr:uncharacterized protein FIBRA_07917 [Fibroporia radiculosa]CCM05686.1 predicted protein [Fibroporia radiculosa]